MILWHNGLGSTRAITNSAGNVTDTYSYDAWGNVTSHNGPTSQPYQFVGQLGYYTHYQEPILGLMQLGVRFYDPAVGRFTQRDPVPSLWSVYLYGNARPTTYVDPTGALGTCSITTVKLSGYCHVYKGTKYIRTNKLNGTKVFDTCGRKKKKCWLIGNFYLVGTCSVSGSSMLPGGYALLSCGFNVSAFGICIPGLQNLKLVKIPAPLKLEPGHKVVCNVTAEAWIDVWTTP